jgi:hypothetical protein
MPNGGAVIALLEGGYPQVVVISEALFGIASDPSSPAAGGMEDNGSDYG